jgi:hypothetical protein
MRCTKCSEQITPNPLHLTPPASRKKGWYKVYHQACPNCDNPILGIRVSDEGTGYSEEYKTTMENMKFFNII